MAVEDLGVTVVVSQLDKYQRMRTEVVAGAGIEPATRGFSVRCSTN
jgi:hypothetical protein